MKVYIIEAVFVFFSEEQPSQVVAVVVDNQDNTVKLRQEFERQLVQQAEFSSGRMWAYEWDLINQVGGKRVIDTTSFEFTG